MGWLVSLRLLTLTDDHFWIGFLMAATLTWLPFQATALIPDQDDQLEDLSQFTPNWFAEMQDIELDDDRAYLFGVGGMAVFNISDPALPLFLGRYEPQGHPFNRYYRGAVNGDLVCGGGREDLLSIMDVSHPAVPILLAVHGTAGHSYEGVAMQDTYAYACRHGYGFEIIDISVPELPVSLSEIPDLINSWDVALAGNLAYVADGLGGLAVIDITDPGAPVHLRSVPTSGAAVDVALRGTLAVVSVGSAGLDVFDLSNAREPVLVSTINTSGLAVTAAIVGDMVYVADWDDVESYDLSNPARPVAVGGEDTPVRAMGLDAREDLVIVADWSRMRLYRPGPSTRGDIQISVASINLGFVPFGGSTDTTFAISNTGGAPLNVSSVQGFGGNFVLPNPGPFLIPPGGSVEVIIEYTASTAGLTTFLRIDSDDTDEARITFPVSVIDNPKFLDLGSEAPDWTLLDMDQKNQSLSSARGKVVVMAFFANW